ncbi:MAG: lipopolysaccharide assembly protein LapA domain-containing protein [Acidobacteriota bacterium]
MLTLLFIILVFVVIILFQNSQYVRFKVLFWQFSAHKVLLIIGSMLFGYIIGKLIEMSALKRR